MPYINLVSTGIRTMAMLCIVLGVLVMVLYVFRKGLFLKRWKKGDAYIKIISSLNIGAKERIQIVEIEGERLALGITPGRIAFLTKVRKDSQKLIDKNGRTGAVEIKKV